MNLHNCSLNKIKFTFQLLSLKCYFLSSMCFIDTRRTCCFQCLCRLDHSVIRLSTGCNFRRFMLGYHILMAFEGFGLNWYWKNHFFEHFGMKMLRTGLNRTDCWVDCQYWQELLLHRDTEQRGLKDPGD